MDKLLFFNKLIKKLNKAKPGEVVHLIIDSKSYYIKKINHETIKLLKNGSKELS